MQITASWLKKVVKNSNNFLRKIAQNIDKHRQLWEDSSRPGGPKQV